MAITVLNDLPRYESISGQYVERTSSDGGRTEQLFDPAGQLLGHFNGGNGIWREQYMPFDGRLLWHYTQATNASRYFHANALGSPGLATDAAGDQLNDQLFSYQYSAEGRVKLSHSISNSVSQCSTVDPSTPGQWQCPMYNALGQRVEDYQADALGDGMTLT